MEMGGRELPVIARQDAASVQPRVLLVAGQMVCINFLFSCLAAELGPGLMLPSMPLFPLLHRRQLKDVSLLLPDVSVLWYSLTPLGV